MEMAAARVVAAVPEVAVRFIVDHDRLAGKRRAQQLGDVCGSGHARDGISRAINTD